jgi:hypothetical protein
MEGAYFLSPDEESVLSAPMNESAKSRSLASLRDDNLGVFVTHFPCRRGCASGMTILWFEFYKYTEGGLAVQSCSANPF